MQGVGERGKEGRERGREELREKGGRAGEYERGNREGGMVIGRQGKARRGKGGREVKARREGK